MKLLILGGTRFIGRHLVGAALAHNHEVTLFNRGKLSSPLAGVETIHGNRNSDLGKLQGRNWDSVIDTCGYLPDSVRASAEALSGAIAHYVFISSLSVYADVSKPGIDETAAVATLTHEQLEKANAIDSSGQVSALTYGEMYGGLKALCEQALEEILPNRVMIIRPGLIVGSHDYTDRFTYWVERIARRGGEVLAPGRPERFIQLIDVRDLAEWIVEMIERKATGIYNATGLPGELTMGRLLEECQTVGEGASSLTWVSDDFLAQEQVKAWSELPLWLPEDAPQLKGFMFVNCERAVNSGLRFRPLRETIQDTLAWRDESHPKEELKAGLSREKEESLLRKWHETR